MEGLTGSKSVRNSDKKTSLSVSRNPCQLCGVAVTKAVAGTSGDEGELRASLEWLHAFLVHLNCLEEGEKRLLDCSNADICENCKSNLKFAKKHGERAVAQHEKVKRMWEEFTDELQILQDGTGSAILKLQKALGGAGSIQGELLRAIGKANDNFKGLQESSMGVLSFLGSKFTGNSGLFPIPNIAAENESDSQAVHDQQDLHDTHMVKVEGGTGTLGEESDEDENEQKVDPRVTSAYSIAHCYVEEDTAENGSLNSPAVKLEAESSGRSNGADNHVEIVSLESSDEEDAAPADDNQDATGKIKKRSPQENITESRKTASRSLAGTSGTKINDDGNSTDEDSSNGGNSEMASSRKQNERETGKKRKLAEDSETSTANRKMIATASSFASSGNKNSCKTGSHDVEKPKMISLLQASAGSEIAQASIIRPRAAPIFGYQSPKRMTMSSEKLKSVLIRQIYPTDLKDPSKIGDINQGLSVRRDHDDSNMDSAHWTKKLKEIESSNVANAITLLNYMAYLKQVKIRKDLLINLIGRSSGEKRVDVQRKVNAAVKFLLKHSLIEEWKMVQNLVFLSISPDLQTVLKAKLCTEGKEKEVLEELMIVLGTIRIAKGKISQDDKKSYNDISLEENVEHALSVWKCAVKYTEIIQSGSSLLCHTFAVIKYKERNLKEEGIQFGEAALERFREALGPCHPNCFRLEKHILVLVYLIGKYAEAAEKLKELARKYENVLKGKDDYLLQEIRAEQGEALVLLGRYEEALTIQRQVLDKTRNKKGEQSRQTIEQENRYVKFLLKAHKICEAQALHKSVEEKLWKVKLSKNQLVIVSQLKAQMNVAFTYFEMGSYEQALKILKDAYKSISSWWEKNVPLFSQISYWLGRVLLYMNNFTEAMKHFSTDYEKAQKELGKDYFWTLLLLQSLGSAHRGNGTDKKGLETALKMHQEAYRGLFEDEGKENVNSISAKNDIAIDLSMLGRHEEALQMFKECISEMENIKKPDPEDPIEVKLDYAESLERSGESPEEVMRLLEATKEEIEKVEGKIPRLMKRVTDLISLVQEKMYGNK